jgi:hypothetical protein
MCSLLEQVGHPLGALQDPFGCRLDGLEAEQHIR